MAVFSWFILGLYFFYDCFYFFLFILVWAIRIFFSGSWGGIFLFVDSNTFILLVVMTIFILGLVLLSEKNYIILILSEVLVLISIIFFFSFSILFMYIFFELSMFPIIIIILGYGSQIEKINSTFYLIFYASFCSFPFLFLYFYYDLDLGFCYFTKLMSWELLFFLSLGFLIKFPVYFLHLWLPKAHVEAPTTASMLLAGLLLKLGTAGFLRFIKSFRFIHLNFWFFISFIGMCLGALSCIFQSDAKSLAAYSSITHIGFLLLCLLLLSLEGKTSSLLLILAHGYTSSLIFFLIGEYYHSSSTRIIYYLNSFLNLRIFFSLVFILTFLRNAGMPPSLSFLSEFICISFSLNLFSYLFYILLKL